MNHKRFTLNYYEGEELPEIPIDQEFDTIAEAIGWCTANKVPFSIVSITEWDLSSIGLYGVPDIIASVNLKAAVFDKAEDLIRYI